MSPLFTLTAHDGTTGWKKQIEREGMDWQPWVHSEDAIKRALEREEDLPKIEVARFFWEPGWADEKLLFPIVVKRTWVPVRETKHLTTLKKSETNIFSSQAESSPTRARSFFV